MTAVRADGSEFPTELAITRIPLDGPPSFTGYLRDITERKQSEEELRRSEAFLTEAQQLSRVGSFSWRVATDEIMWSEQLYRIFEIDRDVPVTFDAIGTRIHPEDVSAFTEQIERSRRDGSDVQLEIRLQMPGGTVKYVHVVAHRRQESRQLEYIGAVQDVTQRPSLGGGAREGPIGARLRRQGDQPRRVDGIDRARSQPAAGWHRHQRRHLSADAGRRSSGRRRCARNREADHSRRQPRLGCDHAVTGAVQQEGIHAGAAGSERGHARGHRAVVERPSEKPGDPPVGARRRPPDRSPAIASSSSKSS